MASDNVPVAFAWYCVYKMNVAYTELWAVSAARVTVIMPGLHVDNLWYCDYARTSIRCFMVEVGGGPNSLYWAGRQQRRSPVIHSIMLIWPCTLGMGNSHQKKNIQHPYLQMYLYNLLLWMSIHINIEVVELAATVVWHFKRILHLWYITGNESMSGWINSSWPSDTYCIVNLGQQWIRKWLGACWHQAITWFIVDWSSTKIPGPYLNTEPMVIPMLSTKGVGLKMISSNWHLLLSGASKLKGIRRTYWRWELWHILCSRIIDGAANFHVSFHHYSCIFNVWMHLMWPLIYFFS